MDKLAGLGYLVDVKSEFSDRPDTLEHVVKLKINRRGKLIVWQLTASMQVSKFWFAAGTWTHLAVQEGCPFEGAHRYVPPAPPLPG